MPIAAHHNHLMTNAKPAAFCTIDRTPYSARDIRDLNRAAKLLSKHGALSVERLAKLSGMWTLGAAWAFFHIGATLTSSGLYTW